MSWPVAARIARRELRGGLRGFRVFLACLALGVAAIAAVGSVRESIDLGLSREGAKILGGDAEIELTYRFAKPEERAWMEKTADAVSEIVEFRSMAVAGEGDAAERGLTQVKAVDKAYPLLGAAELEPAMPLPVALSRQDGVPGAVMDRVLVARLGLKIGDRFRLGEQPFRLSAVLLREPDNGGGGFSFGPRTLVRTADLADSGLLQPGTLFDTHYRLKLPPGANLDAVKAGAKEAISGGGFRWRDSRNGAPGVRAFVDRLGNFLVLVGLAGLAVGGVGVSAAVRAYLEEKVAIIATLKSLGADGSTIFQTYALQIGVLTMIGTFAGLALGAAAPVVLAPLIEARLPVPVVSAVHVAPLAEAALYGVLAAAMFTLWPLARAQDIRAAALYRDAAFGLRGWPGRQYVVVNLALLIALLAAAALLTGQARLTLWSAAGIIGAFVTLVLAAILLARAAGWLSSRRALRGRTVFRLAFGSVGGPGGETMSVVLSLGLGLSVLAAVGQIDFNLRGAIARDLPKVAPSFFVVDIQKDEMPAFRAMLENDPSVSRIQAAPMLRGLITRINGRPAREVAGNHWVVSGDRGVTYAASPPPGTRITAGNWWPQGYTGEPQISFAADEAREIGLKLGDTLTVNVLGRDITGRITSFRKVDFSNAGLGFVLSMNPAAVAGAPHTFISTIYADQRAEPRLLRDLSQAFPNITVISVRDAIRTASDILSGIAAAVTYGALAALLTGGVVLVGAAAAGERKRRYEAAILKTLGATRAQILANFAMRSVLMGAAAGLVAVVAGAAGGWAVMTFVMKIDYRFDLTSALVVIGAGVFATILTSAFFSLRSLSARPARVLRARE